MPTYQYACRSCGHRFEVVQPMTEEPLTRCPECEGELRKVYAPPAIAFRGSGFYATDHGKKAAKTETSKAESDGSTGSGGATDTSDKKAATTGGSDGAGDAKPKGPKGSKAAPGGTGSSDGGAG